MKVKEEIIFVKAKIDYLSKMLHRKDLHSTRGLKGLINRYKTLLKYDQRK